MGNLLGMGDEIGAALAARVSLVHAAAWSIGCGLTLCLVPHGFFPSFFTLEEEVVREVGRTFWFLAFYVVFDGVQVALNGVVKGCGRQCVTMPIVVVAYWAVGLPLGYYLAFVRGEGEMECDEKAFCGVLGLVVGMTMGTFVHLLLMFVVVGCTDWKIEAAKTLERLGGEEKGRANDNSEEKLMLLGQKLIVHSSPNLRKF